MKGKFEGWMFGCDICQDVCPWNRFATKHEEKQFLPSEQLLEMHKNDWEEITEEVFKKLFKVSPLKRTKYSGIKRNIEFIKTNSVKSDSGITH
jgi:epoxyqueuosine reductase